MVKKIGPHPLFRGIRGFRAFGGLSAGLKLGVVFFGLSLLSLGSGTDLSKHYSLFEPRGPTLYS